jgi:hypothetical protein
VPFAVLHTIPFCLAVIEKFCGASSDEETSKDNPFALFFETRSDIPPRSIVGNGMVLPFFA